MATGHSCITHCIGIENSTISQPSFEWYHNKFLLFHSNNRFFALRPLIDSYFFCWVNSAGAIFKSRSNRAIELYRLWLYLVHLYLSFSQVRPKKVSGVVTGFLKKFGTSDSSTQRKNKQRIFECGLRGNFPLGIYWAFIHSKREKFGKK